MRRHFRVADQVPPGAAVGVGELHGSHSRCSVVALLGHILLFGIVQVIGHS